MSDISSLVTRLAEATGTNPTFTSMDNGGYHVQAKGAFDLFLPNNYQNSDSMSYYFTGSGGYGGEGEQNIFQNILADIQKSGDSSAFLALSESSNKGYLNEVASVLNPSGFTNYNAYGWSAGASTALRTTADMLISNPNMAPQTVCMLESDYNGRDINLSSEQLQALKNNGTTVLMLESENIPGTTAHSRDQSSIQELANNANVVLVYSNGDHVSIGTDAFNRDLIGFINGTNPSFADNYTFEVYDKNTGQFRQVSAQEALDSGYFSSPMGLSGDNFFGIGFANILDAISHAERAAKVTQNTPSLCAQAESLAGSVKVDLSSWIQAAHKNTELLNDSIYQMASKLMEIYADTMELDPNLMDYLSKYDTDISKIPEYVAQMHSQGKSDADISSFFCSMVACGYLDASNLKDAIIPSIGNGSINESTLADIGYKCQTLLSMYNHDDYDKNGYFRNLTITDQPVSAMLSELKAAYIANGMSESAAQLSAENYINNLNSSIENSLIKNNTMYSGEGVAQVLLTTAGVMTSFGYMMNYGWGGTYELNNSNGLLFGTASNPVSTLDCNNLFDWACHGAGVASTSYRAEGKWQYAAMAGESESDLINDGRKVYYSKDENGNVSDQFKSGNAGDIIICKDGTHMLVVVGKDEYGYYVGEETCTEDNVRSQGFRIHYYGYDEIGSKLGENSSLVHMDNLYANVTPSSQGDGQTYTTNNYIPAEVISNTLGLSNESTDMLKAEFTYHNKNSAFNNIYSDISKSTTDKVASIIPLKTSDLYSGLDGIRMDVPDNGRSIKTYEYASSVTNVNSPAFSFLNSDNIFYDSNGFCKYKDSDGEEYYCVAMGRYYAGEVDQTAVGRKFRIELEDGKTINVITGDVKSNAHTDPNRQYTSFEDAAPNILEFIVSDKFKSSGNVAKSHPDVAGGDITGVVYLGDLNGKVNTISDFIDKTKIFTPVKSDTTYKPGTYANSSSYNQNQVSETDSQFFDWSSVFKDGINKDGYYGSTTGVTQEQTVTPVTQEPTVTPVAQEPVVTPVTQEQTVTPVAQEQTVTPVTQEQSVTPVTQEQTVTPVTPSNTSSTRYSGNNSYSTYKKQETTYNFKVDGEADVPYGAPLDNDFATITQPTIEETPVVPTNQIPTFVPPVTPNTSANSGSDAAKIIGGVLVAGTVAAGAYAAKKVYDGSLLNSKGSSNDDEYIDDMIFIDDLNNENNIEEKKEESEDFDEYGLPKRKEVVVATEDEVL